ncbi:MAG TPA: type II toxin-antitoxin system HipA family toxin [Rhodospirillaceae bacterium]|nr:type II toxin-antitoxin system HipA family toxin [Rhodospirillaceae bacterium]
MTQKAFEPVRLLHVDMTIAGTRRRVGRLGKTAQGIFFEYDPAFPRTTHDISPFCLKEPPGSTAIPAPIHPFDGLHGVFDDSLPDGWGRLLMDRKLLDLGLHPRLVSPLDRLAWIGDRGMGALTYKPVHKLSFLDDTGPVDLDRLAAKSRRVLSGSTEEVVDELLQAGGSPGGARPKALVGRSDDGSRLIHGAEDLPAGFSHWLTKFGIKGDMIDVGAVEHAYALMAREAGVVILETTLLPAKSGPGYFAIRRFDRRDGRRIHMHTVAGLLQASHRLPSMSYEDLLKATMLLTRDQRQVDQMFARMVFNVFAHNRDDHTKNHAFLMEDDGTWSASPAYDLTYSPGAGGEHALTIGGEGAMPVEKHIEAAGRTCGVSEEMIDACIYRTRTTVSRWREFADLAGVAKKTIAAIDLALNGNRPKHRKQ